MDFRKTFVVTAMLLCWSSAAQAAATCDLAEGAKVKPIEPNSFVEKFFHRIAYRALEQVGYDVLEPAEAEYATNHLAVAQGDADFTASHWNVLHSEFFEQSGGETAMTRVGTVVSGAVQGYSVDKASYDAGVHSIEDLKAPDVAKRFDGNNDGKADLAGCSPGWGCEAVIERHLTELGLRDTVEHNQGSYDAIMADVIARFNSGEPIIYFTWTPYWVPARLVPGRDVEWIAVPKIPGDEELYTDYQGKNLGFGIDHASFLVNNDFLEENPAAKAIFDTMTIDISDVSAEAARQQDGESSIEDVERHADDWIAANQGTFDGWIQNACAALVDSK